MAPDKERSTEKSWHSLDGEQVLAEIEASREGLSSKEAALRLETHGPNRMTERARRSGLVRFLLQFHNILIYVLIGAGLVTGLLAIIDGPSHWVDTFIIFAVVIINALVGFIQEGKAEEALEAIRNMLSREATVMRDGNRVTIDAADVVPGDIVVLRTGDKVPADIRLLEARDLRIDEAALTGESVPADKEVTTLAPETTLGDRSNMAFSSMLVTGGSGLGVAVSTGDDTQIGRISSMVSETPEITTPLIRQMDHFGKIIAVVIILLAVVTFVFGVFVGGQSYVYMFLAAVALAVAAIPEGLPAVMTIILALGVRRMAARHAIIRRLAAVDTLGALMVVCSDKTGTLTRNEMTVTTVALAGETLSITGGGYAPEGDILGPDEKPHVPADDSPAAEMMRLGVLCNDSDITQEDGRWRADGDPMEGALLTLGKKAGIDIAALRREHPVLDSIPFDSTKKYMATLHELDGGRVLLLKGAPERVLDLCNHQLAEDGLADIDRDGWDKRAESMAADGKRVLAAARRIMPEGTSSISDDDLADDLALVGLWGIIDPPRDEAIEAVAHCQEAGIRVVMITGDHAMTAKAIGRMVGIGDGEHSCTGSELDAFSDTELSSAARDIDIFARVSPEHKLSLVRAMQAHGQVVAMTGDGVNDAPALKRADVGVAMGIKGTEVTKEAADMVLTDDNFVSIANAVEEGRTVYDNLRKSILFILPTNGGEGLTILMAILLGRSLPLTPVQVLWVNMVTAVTLALALSFEKSESDVMQRPPRDPASNLLSRYFVWRILYVSVIICAGVFGAFMWMRHLGMELEVARTVAVNALVGFEIFYLYNCRKIIAPVLHPRELLANMHVVTAIGIVIVLQLAFTYLPPVQALFGTAAISASHWVLVVILGIALFAIVELEKTVIRMMEKRKAPETLAPTG
ncbi:MAG: cation-transporting P-type ATPase [Candidatus Sumerlaeia bacterium]|nr:cation-transporting P-type ATPase [Candidatus Sumerlaeia bacterium]